MKCPACQQPNVDGARFCAACGIRLTSTGADERVTARFCIHCGQPLSPVVTSATPGSYTPKHLAEKILTSRAALEGERKQVTVLFADVENFTRLGDRMDPEDLHALMDRVFGILLDSIHRYEGTVNQFTGDGVMALFGAPLALEDHALRAVEASLEVQRTMLDRAEEFRAAFQSVPQLRIGLNTGRVVVGKIGDDLRMDYTAQGDTVNLAARLQAVAEAGTVAMSATTHRLVAETVETMSLGPHRLKGKELPVEVYRPVRLKDGHGGLVAAEHQLAPFVGRDAELDRLLALYEDVRAGHARAAILVGDAGVGKSRLLLEARQRLADARWFVGHCAPYGRTTPYRPIVEILRSTFGLAEGDSDETVSAKLDKRLAELGDDAQAIGPALRWLLGAGTPDPAMAILSGADRKAAIMHALDVLTRRVASRTPHVFVFEACQWLDPASEEFLAAVSRGSEGSALFVFTCRPDEGGGAPVGLAGERIVVRPLEPRDARGLVSKIAPGLPPDVVDLVAERTRGNPLFLEEVTRTVVETGAAQIPPTVEGVLMARIDRLPRGAKSVLQTTSVIGRTFSRALLERVVDDVEGLPRALDTLVSLGLIQRSDTELDVYSCEQPLVHEVTYEGLLHQHRRALHKRIGLAMEEVFAHRLVEHVEDLARHFARAEDWPRAVKYHREAGRKAAALSANAHAASWFTRTLELVPRLPADAAQARLTVEIRLDLCRALFQLGRLDEALRHAREAEALAKVTGDDRRLGEVYAYVANHHYMKGEPDLAIQSALECLALDTSDASRTRRAARQYLGTSYHVLGEYRMAERILTEQLAELEQSEWFERLGPVNLSYVSSAGWLAFTFAELGEFTRARDATERATRAARHAGHPYAQAIAASFDGLSWHLPGDEGRALPLLETAFGLCVDHQLEVWRPVAAAMLGHASAMAGKVERGLDLLWEATRLTEKLGVQAYRALWLAYLADALLLDGRTAQAVDVARSALDLAVQNKEQGNHTRALQVLGTALIRQAPSAYDRAHDHLRQAIEQAERLGMRPLLVACYSSLAALARRQREDAAEGFLATARSLAQELGLVGWWKRLTTG